MRLATLGILIPFLVAGCAHSARSPFDPLLKGRRAAVFVFLAPDCPLSQNYTPTLNELRAKFQTNGIEFYGVFAGQPAAEEAGAFVKTYDIRFPVLPDADFEKADSLEASTTPEVFVLDGKGRTLYAGAIDNRAPELGRRRTVITENYLRDALDRVVEGREVPVHTTRPVGCFIERARRSHLLPDTERR